MPLRSHESRHATLAVPAPEGAPRRMPAHLRWTRTEAAPRPGTGCMTFACGARAVAILAKPGMYRRRPACASCASFLTGERERAG